MIACDPPLAPIGYIGWAASPSSVTRPCPQGTPCPQNGSGSRSTIGYCRICAVPAIRAGTSSQPNLQSANQGSTSLAWPMRFQSARSLAAGSWGRLTSATQLSRALPSISAWREIG
jgi:hypothetical protein